MAGTADATVAKIQGIEARVLEIQAELAASGMSAAEEAKVDAALDHLKTVADPVAPNPPDVPPDPGA
jgi:hypothetical protein